jgi:Fur family ferric uptake transcriptional regulator
MSLFKFKKTPARTAITEFLSKADYPVDILQVIDFLRSKDLNTNKVTVYRVMNFLFKNRIVDRVEFGEGKFRYEIKKTDHHHLICTNCGSIEDIQDIFMEDFEKDIKQKRGFLVKHHSLEFFGLCKNCQN